MENHLKMHIRYMREQDLADVVRIQSKAHAECLHETLDVFKHKLSIFKEGCFVAQSNIGICGYLFSHPWVTNDAVPFNSIYSLPHCCSTYYIHDCSVDPDFRYKGIGLQLFTESKKTAIAHNFSSLHLTCINGMQNYWIRMGFTIAACITTRNYGDEAFLMHTYVNHSD